MVNGRAERIAAREAVIRAALAVVTTERTIAEDPAGVRKLAGGEAALELAARDLTVTVDDSPSAEQPKRWRE